jgi:hypothetical protein
MVTPGLRFLGAGASALLLAAQALTLPPAHAQEGPANPEESRPRGLVLLLERLVPGGKQALGVYDVRAEAAQPGVVRIKVWDETPNNVLVRSETIRCAPAEPLRVTSDGKRLFLRNLNPGGLITPANRIDHLIWWAACFPAQAGRDPATLAGLARQLGYSGNLRESELVLPGGATSDR